MASNFKYLKTKFPESKIFKFYDYKWSSLESQPEKKKQQDEIEEIQFEMRKLVDDDFELDNEIFPVEFFNYHRARLECKHMKKEDHLSEMPDEMLLKILHWLPKPALGNLAQTSKKFNHLVSDETLWHRIDCIGKILTAEQLNIVMVRKPTYLRLAKANVPDSIQLLPCAPQLLYLDLSMAIIKPNVLSTLLGACSNLQNLSLEHLEVPPEVLATALTFAHSIEVLNLAMCYQVDATRLSRFLSKCQKMRELNMACIKQTWSTEDMGKVMSSLPTGLEQLNVCGFREKLNDTHVQILASRCPNLIDLDLSDSQVLTIMAIEGISHLEKLQHLSLSRCNAVEPQAYSILAQMKSLRYLELYSLFKEASLGILSRLMPNVKINQFPFSAIARPTYGMKRSSIWGKRIRN